MATTYTIEQWLQGMVDFNVPDSAIKAILYNNNIATGVEVASLSQRQRELALADLYMWLATSSSSSSGEYESDGGWQRQRSNKNVVDRAGYKARAMQLYIKWGSEKAVEIPASITMRDLY